MYNSLVNLTQKRHKEMMKTRKYRILLSSLSNDKKKEKDIWKQINEIRKKYRMSEYSFHEDVKQMQKHFKDNIDAFSAQKIASAVWKAYDKLFFGNGDNIHFKRYNTLNCLEGKSNKTGIRFQDACLIWNGLKIPVLIGYDNDYEYQAMKCDISYYRILRKFVHNKNHYYVQIVVKGNPPVKVDADTGEIKHSIGCGDVGIDIGTSTIAISSESDVKLLELADKVQNIENQKRFLLRKMDIGRKINGIFI